MEQLLKEDRFNFVSKENKKFISAFTKQMDLLGYDFGGKIEDGYSWGKYMIIYSKKDVKTKKIIARIFIRDNGIVLRLFFKNIDKHKSFIENAPFYIKNPFINEQGRCVHCREKCSCTKIYTIDGKKMEKCTHQTFEFIDPKMEYLKDYMEILNEFYKKNRSK